MAKDPFDLKLQAAKVVDTLPTVDKGSKIDSLPEFQDAMAIIKKVKEVGRAPERPWQIFDKADAEKRTPSIKNFKTLVTAFAAKVRAMIEHEGVGKQIKLEQRKNTFYLVGVGKK